MNNSTFRRNWNNEALSNNSTIVAGASGVVFSSTPSMTPLENAQLQAGDMNIQLRKGNMNLPLEASLGEHMNQSTGHGTNKRHNVTVRDRYDSSMSSGGSLISPIIPSFGVKHKNVQLTEPRGFNKQLSGEEEECSSGSKSIFPFPKVGFNECDPGEMLCSALKALNVNKKLEAEKLRLHGPKKRKDKEETVVYYEFHKETFTTVNSEAANHALYLIFSTLDVKETEQRFRDCWPVYEKKLEGVFRRVALDWIKQLVEMYPDFFQDVRTEAIGGLLVNPGGERFITFLRQLCRLALFTVANNKKGLIKQQVLLPPTPCSDPEIENRQLHVLETRAHKNAEALTQMYKKLARNEMGFSLRLRTLEENLQHLQRIDAMQSAKLMSCVKNCPDLFGNPTESELQARDASISSIKLRDIMANGDYDDILRTRLESALKTRCEEIYKSVSEVQDVMEEFGTIWHVLEMDKSAPSVLDCNKLLVHQLQNNSETPSLGIFMKTFLNLTGNLISNEYLNTATPANLLQEFETLSCRIKFLEIMEEEVKKNVHNDSDVIEQAELKRNVMKLRMNDFDWSQLSRVYEDGLSQLWDMTPVRVYDINRTSGWTPGLNNFLDSSSSSSSGEHQQQTSVVRRRNAHMIKAKMRSANPQRSRSESKDIDHDTIDGIPNNAMNSNLSSTQIDATPLSSTRIDSCSKSLHNSSLFCDSITGTPTSAVSMSSTTRGTSSSFRMRKSLSFSATPTSTTSSSESSFSSVISIRQNQRKNLRYSSGVCCSSFSGEHTSIPESPLSFGTGSRDMLSRLSFASSTGTPVELDSSTQDRLNKLMESVALKNHINRTSLSPIAGSELDTADISSEKTQANVEVSPILNHSSETMKKHDSFEQLKIQACESEEGSCLIDFGDTSIIEDFEGVKGIMETSFVDLLRNSDSDD